MTNSGQQLMNLHYSDATGNEFVILQVWNPNEENDPWVKYENIQTEEVYTCRLEAFQSRFHLMPSDREYSARKAVAKNFLSAHVPV